MFGKKNKKNKEARQREVPNAQFEAKGAPRSGAMTCDERNEKFKKVCLNEVE